MDAALVKTIERCSYYGVVNQSVQTLDDLTDEIRLTVCHLQPFESGSKRGTKSPSVAFCLLRKLLSMEQLTGKQVKALTKKNQPVYVRCIALLASRYMLVTKSQLWERMGEFVHDDSPVVIEIQEPDNDESTMTIGQFVQSLLTETEFMETRLPKLIPSVLDGLRENINTANQIEERAKLHEEDSYAMKYFQTIGNRVRALYEDDKNPPKWYDAYVYNVIYFVREEREMKLDRPRFVVTFPAYGNTAVVSLGELGLPWDLREASASEEDDYEDEDRFSLSRKSTSELESVDYDEEDYRRYLLDELSSMYKKIETLKRRNEHNYFEDDFTYFSCRRTKRRRDDKYESSARSLLFQPPPKKTLVFTSKDGKSRPLSSINCKAEKENASDTTSPSPWVTLGSRFEPKKNTATNGAH